MILFNSYRSPLNPKGGSTSSVEQTDDPNTMDKEAGGSKFTQKASMTLYLAAASALFGAIGWWCVNCYL